VTVFRIHWLQLGSGRRRTPGRRPDASRPAVHFILPSAPAGDLVHARMVEFDAVFARAYSAGISPVSSDTSSASHAVPAERVSS